MPSLFALQMNVAVLSIAATKAKLQAEKVPYVMAQHVQSKEWWKHIKALKHFDACRIF